MAKPKGGKRAEKSWGRVLAMVEREIAAGHTDAGEILARVSASLVERSLASQRFRARYEHVGLSWPEDALPAERVAVCDAAYAIVPFGYSCDKAVLETLFEHVSAHADDIDCVVELGSGYGRNLFALSDRVRRQLGIELELHACELVKAGLDVTSRLRDLRPGMNLSVHPFDYFEPNLSFLKGRPDVLFFTVHSIEQIPRIGRAVIDEMIDRSGRSHCFHFEPVGWQYDPELCDWRRRRDATWSRFRDRLFRKLLRASDALFKTRLRDAHSGILLEREDIGRRSRVSRNSAIWSAQADYNTNLVSLLHELEREGRIRIEREGVNAFGDNPFNPATLIEWRGR